MKSQIFRFGSQFDTHSEPRKTGAIALKIDPGGYGGTIYEDEKMGNLFFEYSLESNDSAYACF